MTEDPATQGSAAASRGDGGATAARRAMVLAGHRKDAAGARAGLASADGRVRELALGALARAGALDEAAVLAALDDPLPAVRRRAADLAARLAPSDDLMAALRGALADADPLVVEAACWSLGELEVGDPGSVATLSGIARQHVDARVREAALAALAAIGDPAGLEAVLDALGDRPTVRRRAVVALAAFCGHEVDEALRASAADRDWQVREVAEILLDDPTVTDDRTASSGPDGATDPTRSTDPAGPAGS